MTSKSRRKRPTSAGVAFRSAVSAGQIISRLRDYHRVGREANATTSQSSQAELAETYRMPKDTLRKARTFAARYSAEDLDELCDLRRNDSELPLHWGHVQYLITVANKRARSQFAKQAAKNSWTAPQLYAEIRRHRKKPSGVGGGREINIPEEPIDCLRDIASRVEPWRRRCEQYSAKLTALGPKAKSVTSLLDEIAEKLGELKKTASRRAAGLEESARSTA